MIISVNREERDMQNTVSAKMPECEKMLAIKDKSQAIGEFLDWLAESEHIHLCEWFGDDDYLGYARERTETLLAKFFGIDQDKVEQERRNMLAELRTQHARDAGDLKPQST